MLVHRTTSKTWEGPFTFITVERETDVLPVRKVRSIFSSSCMRALNNPKCTPSTNQATTYQLDANNYDEDENPAVMLAKGDGKKGQIHKSSP